MSLSTRQEVVGINISLGCVRLKLLRTTHRLHDYQATGRLTWDDNRPVHRTTALHTHRLLVLARHPMLDPSYESRALELFLGQKRRKVNTLGSTE